MVVSSMRAVSETGFTRCSLDGKKRLSKRNNMQSQSQNQNRHQGSVSIRSGSLDIGRVPAHQAEIHKRLLNWAMWVTPGVQLSICPMFRATFKSNAWQWHAPEYRETCDTQDAWKIEKEVCKLPKQNRDALVWWYVYKSGALRARKYFGVTLQGLDDLVIKGRQMLINRV